MIIEQTMLSTSGIMCYTIEEVVNGASMFGVMLAFAIIGVVLLMRKLFK